MGKKGGRIPRMQVKAAPAAAGVAITVLVDGEAGPRKYGYVFVGSEMQALEHVKQIASGGFMLSDGAGVKVVPPAKIFWAGFEGREAAKVVGVAKEFK